MLFARQCEQQFISHSVHDHEEEWSRDVLIEESRFADLILASADFSYLREALHDAECPLEEGRYKSIGLQKDGSIFYADVVFTPIYDDKKVLKGFAKITRDISDQKKRAGEADRCHWWKLTNLIPRSDKGHVMRLLP